MKKPTKRLLLLLLPLSIILAGCVSAPRYFCRETPILKPPAQAYDYSKPSPLFTEDTLDQAELDIYLATHSEKSLDSMDISGKQHPLTVAIAQWLGTRYRYGGKSRKGIDCSGFVNEVFESLGIDLPRNSRDIAKIEKTVVRDSLRYGDILIFARRKTRVNHVGIYLSEGRFAHASRRGVTVSTIESGYWAKRYYGARRLDIPDILHAVPPVTLHIEEGGDPNEPDLKNSTIVADSTSRATR